MLNANALSCKKRPRTLIVDDDPIVCQLARSKLESEGHEVVVHQTGQGGWEEAAGGDFDLAVFDLDIPDVHGYTLIERVRSDPRINQLPIIVITSRNHPEAIEKAYDLGATSFVIKPVNWSQFGYQVRYVLRSEERKKNLLAANEKSERANAHKDNIIKVLSHELRTPLHHIIGFSEILQTQLASKSDDAELLGHVDIIADAGRRLLSSLTDIMLFSRILSNDVELADEKYEASRIIEAGLTSVESEAVRRNISVTSMTLAGDCQVTCEFKMLTRVLSNILDNAIKFSSDGGSVHVGTEIRDCGTLAFVVKDCGRGMDKEILDACLSPFLQADGALDRQAEGIGMGLPISKAIVEMHGGSLEISSTPGKGTEVAILVPPERVAAMGKPPLLKPQTFA